MVQWFQGKYKSVKTNVWCGRHQMQNAHVGYMR
jgi:hypothetical protein